MVPLVQRRSFCVTGGRIVTNGVIIRGSASRWPLASNTSLIASILWAIQRVRDRWICHLGMSEIVEGFLFLDNSALLLSSGPSFLMLSSQHTHGGHTRALYIRGHAGLACCWWCPWSEISRRKSVRRGNLNVVPCRVGNIDACYTECLQYSCFTPHVNWPEAVSEWKKQRPCPYVDLLFTFNTHHILPSFNLIV